MSDDSERDRRHDERREEVRHHQGRGGDRRDERGRQRGSARVEGRTQRSAQAPSQRTRHGDPARATAYDVLRAVDEGDSYANLVLPPLLRERGVAGRDAAFATELTYGTLRLRGRYDAIIEQAASTRPLTRIDPPVLDVLRLGAHQLLGMRVPAHAAVSRDGRAWPGSARGRARAVRQRGPARGSREQPSRGGSSASATPPTPRATTSLARRGDREPSRVGGRARCARRWSATAAPADDVAALLAADNAAPRVTLVARPGLVDPADARRAGGRGATHGVVAPYAVRAGTVETRVRAGRSDGPGRRAGRRQPARRARPGGGTAGRARRALARPVRGPGRQGGPARGVGGRAWRAPGRERGRSRIALDWSSRRCGPSRPVRSRTSAQVTAARSARPSPARTTGCWSTPPARACGALRRRPESRWRRTPADLRRSPALQRELLGSALRGRAVRWRRRLRDVLAAPGRDAPGRADAVRAAAQGRARGRARRRASRSRGRSPPARCDLVGDRLDVQLWPHVHGTDAMHLTLLRRG